MTVEQIFAQEIRLLGWEVLFWISRFFSGISQSELFTVPSVNIGMMPKFAGLWQIGGLIWKEYY